MADRENPRTHVENQDDVKLPRVQPESPQHSGIDPLTEGDTMYPSTDTKADSEKLAKKEATAEPDTTAADRASQTLQDQEGLNNDGTGSLTDRDEPSKATTQRTEPVKADGKVQPQTARPANTNNSEVAEGSTEPADSDTNAATGAAPSKNAKAAAKNGSGTSADTAAEADGSATSKTTK